MEFEFLFTFLALGGFAAGFFGGLVGVGGGWLIVPLLTVVGYTPVQAVAISFTQMAPTTFMGALQHYRYGNLKIKPSAALTLGMIVGVIAGTYLLSLCKEAASFSHLYRIGYVIFLFTAAYSMMQRRNMRSQVAPLPAADPLGSISLVGMAAGVISGFFGVGGGVVSVPLMVRLRQLAIKPAVAASLSAIAFCSLFMAIKYWMAGESSLSAAVAILSGSLVGSYMGSKATFHLKPELVTRLFSTLITVTALTLVMQFYSATTGKVFLFVATTILTILTLISYARAKAPSRTSPQAQPRCNQVHKGKGDQV